MDDWVTNFATQCKRTHTHTMLSCAVHGLHKLWSCSKPPFVIDMSSYNMTLHMHYKCLKTACSSCHWYHLGHVEETIRNDIASIHLEQSLHTCTWSGSEVWVITSQTERAFIRRNYTEVVRTHSTQWASIFAWVPLMSLNCFLCQRAVAVPQEEQPQIARGINVP